MKHGDIFLGHPVLYKLKAWYSPLHPLPRKGLGHRAQGLVIPVVRPKLWSLGHRVTEFCLFELKTFCLLTVGYQRNVSLQEPRKQSLSTVMIYTEYTESEAPKRKDIHQQNFRHGRIFVHNWSRRQLIAS